jgi:DNA-directed RNA polymerase specialized sigma24 family protein
MIDEPVSFEAFFRQQLGDVVGFLMKAGFDFDEAQDAAAEAMARAYNRWSRISRPRPWIFTTAYRIALKQTRRDRDGLAKAAVAGWGAPQLIDPCVVVDGYAEVLTVLSVLSEQQRLVMAWTMHGFCAPEIAEEIGLAEATVRSHIRHARVKLRKFFEAANSARRDARRPAPEWNDGEVIDDA